MPPKRGRLGARVAGVVGVLLVVGVSGLMWVRVKQAVARKEQVAQERTLAQAAATRKMPSRTVHAEPTRYRPKVEITGTLRPWRDADVGFELQGRLVRLNVATGDHVKAGKVLAVLDASRAGAQLSQAEAQTRAAEANLALAEDTLRRTEPLVASKAIPEAQAEQARQQVALSRAQLEGSRAAQKLAQTGAGDHTIVAPFNGLVTKAPTATGGVVQPGTALIHIEDLSKFRLSATVTEDDASLLTPGTEVTVSTHDRTVTGKLTTLIPSLDQATRRAPIEIEVPNNQQLLAWSFVRATIDTGHEVSALRVPANARRAGSQNEIVLVRDGKAHVARVPHSVDRDGSWLVRDGLTGDDAILVDPNPDLKEGDAVLLEAPAAISANAEKKAEADSPRK
jgi:membrane fusion protein (multidrug efflux system)